MTVKETIPIRVTPETLKLLKKKKEETKSKSYDDVLKNELGIKGNKVFKTDVIVNDKV